MDIQNLVEDKKYQTIANELVSLIEYPKEQIEIIKYAKELGLDTSNLLNPDLRLDELRAFYSIELYKLPVDNANDYKKYMESMLVEDKNLLTSLDKVEMGFMRQYINLPNITERLHRKFTDLYDMFGQSFLNLLGLKDGYSRSNEHLVHLLHKFIGYVSENDMRELIDKVKGITELTRQHDYLRYAFEEVELKGRLDLMIDNNYIAGNSLYLYLVYKDTGIDGRIIPNFEVENQLTKHIYEGALTRIRKITNKYTIDEIKQYRDLSNKFRNSINKQEKLELC